MATYYSVASESASNLANWNTQRDGLGTPPATLDGHNLIIQAGHQVLWDVNSSAYTTGISGIIVEGGATPGGLYVSDALSAGTYHLKLASGTSISGTLSTNRGTLYANSAGTFASTSPLASGVKFLIEQSGTAAPALLPTNLDVNLRCSRPDNRYIRTCGTLLSGVTVDYTTDLFTYSSHGLTAGMQVMIKSTGDYPSGTIYGGTAYTLLPDTVYWVRTVTTNSFKLAVGGNNDIALINLTDNGTGTISIYNGHQSTSTPTINTIEDISGDGDWYAGAYVCLVDEAENELDVQKDLTIVSKTASSITLSANIDSVQWPNARIYLCSRNITIYSSGGTTSQYLVDYTTIAVNKGGDYWDCEVALRASTNTYGFRGGGNPTYIQTFAGIVWGGSTHFYINTYWKHDGIGCICASISINGPFGVASDYVNQGGYSTSNCIIAGCSCGISAAQGFIAIGTEFRGNGATNNAPISSSTECILQSCKFVGGLSVNNGRGNIFIYCEMYWTRYTDHSTASLSGTYYNCSFYGITYHMAGSSAKQLFYNCKTIGFYCIQGNNSYNLSEQFQTYAICNTYAINYRCNQYGMRYGQFSYDPRSDESTVLYGYVKGYTPGGKTETVAYSLATHGVPIDTIDKVHVSTFEDYDAYTFMRWPAMWVKAGQKIKVRVNHKVDTSSGWVEVPSFVIADYQKIDTYVAGEVLATTGAFTVADGDWHVSEVEYTPTHDMWVTLRMQGKGGNTGGTGTNHLYWNQEVTVGTSGGGGGSVFGSGVIRKGRG